MATRLEPALRPWRLGAAVFGVFGALAVTLAALGVYSVVAFGTALRTREIGVRLALGARPWQVLTLIGRDGVRLSGGGLLGGLVAAGILAPLVQPFLFETSARSPAVYGIVAAVLIVAGLAASSMPALRASRTRLMSVLKTE